MIETVKSQKSETGLLAKNLRFLAEKAAFG